MPNILPVSDLRNYNEVLKNCQVGEPVFLTKNGRGKFVVMDMEDLAALEDSSARALTKMRKVCADVQQLILFRADIIRKP